MMNEDEINKEIEKKTEIEGDGLKWKEKRLEMLKRRRESCDLAFMDELGRKMTDNEFMEFNELYEKAESGWGIYRYIEQFASQRINIK